jgi:hypothetical protein
MPHYPQDDDLGYDPDAIEAEILRREETERDEEPDLTPEEYARQCERNTAMVAWITPKPKSEPEAGE